MDFREGGVWLYQMVGPDGSGAWCRVDFKTIDPQRSFTAVAHFCDDAGNIAGLPMHWNNMFSAAGDMTTVTVEISFDEAADMEKIIAMGFEAGFTAALGNLDELLAKP